MTDMRILLILLVLVAGLLLYVRLSPMDPGRWHVDPETADRPGSPNAYLLRDDDGDAPALLLAAPPDRVGAALEAVITAAPRTTQLAGSAAEGWVTYVQRSRLMGYPDAISIRLTPVAGGTRVSVFSRSRFGYGDAGVNAARVSRWMERLEAALAP
jgi:uncharacterized protein (DUF1499 family)